MTKQEQTTLAQYRTGSNEWYAALYQFASPSGQRTIANTLAARHNGWRCIIYDDEHGQTRQRFVGVDGGARP